MIRIRGRCIRIRNADRWPGRMSREAYCRAVLDVLAAEQKRHQQQHLANGINCSTCINSSSSSGINSSNSCSGCGSINSCGGSSSNISSGYNSSNSSSGNNSSNSSSGINSSSSSSDNNSSNSNSGCGSSNSCGSSSTSYDGSSDGPIMVSGGPIMVRLLLAIDRRRLEDMEDTVQLLLKLREATLLPRPWKG
jgi:hypothetical protein